MDDHDVLAERFEAHRDRLRAVAYQTVRKVQLDMQVGY